MLLPFVAVKKSNIAINEIKIYSILCGTCGTVRVSEATTKLQVLYRLLFKKTRYSGLFSVLGCQKVMGDFRLT